MSTIAPRELATFLLDAWEGALLRSRVEKNQRSLERFLDIGLGQVLR